MICGLIFIVRKNVHFLPQSQFLPAIRDSHFVQAFLPVSIPPFTKPNSYCSVPTAYSRTRSKSSPINRNHHHGISIERAEAFISAVNSVGEFKINGLNFKQAGFCHGRKGENVWKLFFHDISPIILLLAHHTQSERNRKSYG